MPAIVRNLAIIAAAAGMACLADAHSDVLDLFASMTSKLSDDNAAGFMDGFDKSMPDYGKLREWIAGLIAQAEVSSTIESIKDEGDETKRSVDLDWTMQIRSREASGPLVERQQTVHAELVKQKKRWRIVSIAPLDFFEPAKFSQSK
jgi:hypothetical protein